jgi:site-specific recombinase XerD
MPPFSSISPDIDAAAHYASAEKAPGTRKAYQSDFRIFSVWCFDRAVVPLPALPATVAAYLAYEVGQDLRPSTLGRRLAAIQYAHQHAGYEPPTGAESVRATLRGIRRTLGTARNRKAPATADRAKAMARSVPDSLIGLRDRAILLLGFAGALRRSELVALDVADIEPSDKGLRINIRRSKTDQEGEGTIIAISPGTTDCPAKALMAWLSAAEIIEGPIFRPINKAAKVSLTRLGDRSVANIVKAHALRVGLDARRFSGHSLRSGFLTSAAANGASIFKMMDVSRHKSADTLRGYIRDAELFRDHAGAGLL